MSNHGMLRTLIAAPAAKGLRGVLTPPGDKSISHRAIMLASLSEGITEINGFLAGDDNLATATMFAQMGADITWCNKEKTHVRIKGCGLHGLQEPFNVLDAGNSGTCARLISGILAGQTFFSVLNGDDSLRGRPMLRVINPLRSMGANCDGRGNGSLLPLAIRGGNLQALDYTSPVASAQIKSCILFAALFADGETRVREPRPSRDHTERMLPLFGQPVQIDADGTIHLQATGSLHAPADILNIPADPSSACFFAVAASIIADSNLHIHHVGINPRRDGWRRILQRMQANITTSTTPNYEACEPAADLVVQNAALQNCSLDAGDIPDAIDEFPVLFVAAALSEGTFLLQNAKELRVKESDRIASMCTALQTCGVSLQEHDDGVRIDGIGNGNKLRGGVTVDAKGDHRIAMAMAIAAQCADAPIRILNAGAITTSFPQFVTMAQSCGMQVRWDD
ncbi:MAG: 3-phosphoshikimate 1-carboxyvinyltransferase [Mariprofundales bacterium]